MTESISFGCAVIASIGLFACSRDARAEVPKPLPGGHAFDVEVVERNGEGAPVARHFVLSLTGDNECAKLATHDNDSEVSISTCTRTLAGGKTDVEIKLARSQADRKAVIEGRIPLVPGTRALVGRAERVELYVTGS